MINTRSVDPRRAEDVHSRSHPVSVPVIQLDRVGVEVGNFAVRDISFAVPTGAYGVLMGRTGCGKSTLLEAICGLKPVASGRVLLDGRDVTSSKPAERGIGYVPQDGALFPTMTNRRQIGFPLEIRRRPRAEIAARVNELAGMLAIESLLDRRPFGLSGGERQRIALARALAPRPRTLLLDEPLSAVDEATRDGLIELLASVQSETGVTTLHVTHSRAEADRLADHLLRFEDGRVIPATTDPSDPVPTSVERPTD